MTRTHLIVFDADGTLRDTLVPGRPCPHADGEWALRPGVRERLAELPWGPQLAAGIATNQDRVGFGLIAPRTAVGLLRALARAAFPRHARVELELCPHVPADACACRKPAPGMLLAIAARCGVPPGAGLFVGDADTDREAAQRAGMRFAWAHEFFGTE